MFVKYLILFFISMVPIVELRGAIPYSVVFGLPLIPSYIICVIGNMLPVPFIYLFARKILIWGSDKKGIGKFFRFCLEKGEKGGQKLKEKAGRGTFVALLSLLVFRCRAPVHGPVHSLPVFSIWILNPRF